MEQEKKKKFIIAGVITAIIAVLIIIVFIIWNHTPLIKGIIATNMFGTSKCLPSIDNCERKELESDRLPAAGHYKWTCPICKHTEELNMSKKRSLCKECAKLTGRCYRCGKLLNQKK